MPPLGRYMLRCRPWQFIGGQRLLRYVSSDSSDKPKDPQPNAGLLGGLLGSSLNQLEQYLVHQVVPEKSGESAIDVDGLSSHNADLRRTGDLTNRRLLNIRLAEPVSLLNAKDRLQITHRKPIVPRGRNMFTDYLRHSQQHAEYQLLPLLQLYLTRQDSLTQPMRERIVDLLISHKWFHNASVIILQMGLPLEDFLDYANRLVNEQRVLKSSSWMRSLFLLELHRVFALKNSLVMLQLDYLQERQGYNLEKLKFMDLMTQADNNPPEPRVFYNSFNSGKSDPDIECLQLFLQADKIKQDHPMDPTNQILALRQLLEDPAVIASFNAQRNFVGSFSRHFVQLSAQEMASNHRWQSLSKFVAQRKNMYIELLSTYLVKDLKMTVMDYFDLACFGPSVAELWNIYKGYSFSGVRKLDDPFYTPLLTEQFARKLRNDNVFMNNEFQRLMPARKAAILLTEAKIMFSKDIKGSDSDMHYKRFMHFLDAIPDRTEQMQVVTSICRNVFSQKSRLLNFKQTQQLLRLFCRLSNLERLTNDQCKLIAGYLSRHEHHESFFVGVEPLKRVDLLANALEHCAKANVTLFLPCLLSWMRLFGAPHPDYALQLYNNLLDGSSSAATEQDQYTSVSLHNKTQLRNVGGQLFRMDSSAVKLFIDGRIQHVCVPDADLSRSRFRKKIDSESVILEFLVRSYLQSRSPVRIEGRDLGIDSSSFFEMQKVLDAATIDLAFLDSSTTPQPHSEKFDIDDVNLNQLVDSMLDSEEEAKDSESVTSDLDGVSDTLVGSLTSDNTHTRLGEFFDSVEHRPKEEKTALTEQEQVKQMRIFVALRVKAMMIEELVSQEPEHVDELIRQYYRDYRGDIPLCLIHAMMLGSFKCSKLGFDDKLQTFKELEKLGALIFDNNKDTNFRRFVMFKRVHVALINTIIDEAVRINGGTLVTLNWGFRKIIHTPGIHRYEPYIAEWTKKLNEMREHHTGFWSGYQTWD